MSTNIRLRLGFASALMWLSVHIECVPNGIVTIRDWWSIIFRCLASFFPFPFSFFWSFVWHIDTVENEKRVHDSISAEIHRPVTWIQSKSKHMLGSLCLLCAQFHIFHRFLWWIRTIWSFIYIDWILKPTLISNGRTIPEIIVIFFFFRRCKNTWKESGSYFLWTMAAVGYVNSQLLAPSCESTSTELLHLNIIRWGSFANGLVQLMLIARWR